MSKLSKVTTDHEFIRKWAEDRGGRPAAVKRTHGPGKEVGVIRIDFPGYSGRESLEEISRDEFFEKFDDANLAMVYEDQASEGEKAQLQ